MHRTEIQSLEEILKDYVKKMKFEKKFQEIALVRSWEEVVGKALAAHTTKIYINKGILFVFLNSSVVRNELSMLKQPLIEKLNEKAGGNIIYDIIFR